MKGIAEYIIIRSVMPFQKQSRRHNNRSEADKKYGIPAPPLSLFRIGIQCEMQPVPFSDIPSATLGGEMSDSCL